MIPSPLTLEWTPLLGMTGVFLHTYLQALDAHARTRHPLLVPPAAPPPAVLQARLGLMEPWQILGPLYLLTSAGLRAPAPWMPVAGPTSTPPLCLDWPVLDQILAALLPAFDPTHPEHAEADAALRVLAEGGILADAEPAEQFYADGAWPQLLPLLIADHRWVRLFTALHGADAVRTYRRRALAWVDTARHVQACQDQAQADLAAYLWAAQRQEPEATEDGGSAAPAGSDGQGDPAGSALFHPASVPVEDRPTDVGVPDGPVDTGTPGDRTPTYIPTITARSQPVAGDSEQGATRPTLSLPDHAGVAAGSPPAATFCLQRPQEPFVPLSLADRGVSLPDRSLTGDSLTTQDSGNDIHTSTPSDRITSDIRSLVERHLCEAGLFSTRHDAAFWCEVNRILSGSPTRYPHTPGEKKAAERHFKRQGIPIGVVLAALRVVMSLPDRPSTFAEALALVPFQAAAQHALTLLPQPSADSDWHAFLHAYRQIGRASTLRDVGVAGYTTLQALFAAQPDRCRQVIARWAEVPPPRVSPATLRRALMQARGVQQPFLWTAPPAHAADDPRRALLLAAGLSPKLLTPGMTEDYLHAWIAEADARAAELKSRLGWLTWGIRSGHLPQDHPQLQTKRGAHRPVPPPPPPPAPPISAEQQAWQAVWSAVQTRLAQRLPAQDYATWLHETALLDLAPGQAIVGTPNIFARERVAAQYAPLIAQALEQHTRQPVQVQVVLDQTSMGYGGRV